MAAGVGSSRTEHRGTQAACPQRPLERSRTPRSAPRGHSRAQSATSFRFRQVWKESGCHLRPFRPRTRTLTWLKALGTPLIHVERSRDQPLDAELLFHARAAGAAEAVGERAIAQQ